MLNLLLKYIINFLFFVIKPSFFRFINKRFNQIYTHWKVNEFKKASSIFLCYPLYLKGGQYIEIGNNVDFDQRFCLEAIDSFLNEKFKPTIVFGDNVSIQKDCHIGAINKIIIGNNVLLASKVYISDHSHGEITFEAIKIPPAKRKLFTKGPIIIEDNVWIGEGVVVLPNVTIGQNSIVGANSVVTKSFPKNSVIAGNPAILIRKLQ